MNCSPDTNTDTNKLGDWMRTRTNRAERSMYEKCLRRKGFCTYREHSRTF